MKPLPVPPSSPPARRSGILLALLLLALAACAPPVQRFESDSGFAVTARGPWSELARADYADLYDDAQADASGIELALARDRGETGYFVLRSVPAGEELDKLADFLTAVSEHAAEDRAATEAELRNNGYTDREIDQMQSLLDGERMSDAAYLYLLQEIYLQRALYTVADFDGADYRFQSIEDVRIAGRPVQVAHFDYVNAYGTELRELDAYVIRGDMVYELTLWSDRASLEAAYDDSISLLASLELPAEATAPPPTEPTTETD